MKNKNTDFDEFFVATLLADLFDPNDSDDLNFVAKKIVDGLIDNKIIEDQEFEDDELIAS